MSVHASLHARSLTLTLGRATILDDVDLVVSPGWRIGLVGPNGVGKSTLLRVLGGASAPDAGTVDRRSAATPTVGYLPQEPERRADETVVQFLGRRTGVGGGIGRARRGDGDARRRCRRRRRPVLRRARPVAGARRRRLRVADRWGVGRARPRRTAARPADDRRCPAARRRGSASPSLLLARFDVVPARRADQRPRPRRARPLERWARSLQAGDGGGQPRPRVPAPNRHPRRRARRVHPRADDVRRRLGRATSPSASSPPSTPASGTRSTPTRSANLAGRAQREREWATQGLSRAKKDPPSNDKNIKAFKINQTEQLAGKAARTEKAIERLEVVDEPREAWQLRLTFGEATRSGAVVARLDRCRRPQRRLHPRSDRR